MAITKITNDQVGSPSVGNIPAQEGVNAQELRFDINRFFLEYNRSAVPVNTYYPVLQKRLAGSLSNVQIEGNMMTSYAGVANAVATHGYSLIQVGKTSTGVANALGGYGIAWKPLVGGSADPTAYPLSTIRKVGTGEYNLVLSDPYPVQGFPQQSGYLQIPYRSTTTFVFVPVQFMDYLDGGKTIRALSGNTELLDGLTVYTDVTLYLVKPNVYIVDYTSSVNDVTLWDNLSDEMGFLSFLNCGVADIQPDINYSFTLTITEDNGLTFSIDSPAFTISSPARIPMYDYVAAEDTDSIGISVYGTDGYKWYYDNIRISSLAEQYPYLYCIFSTEGLREDIYVKTTARGYKGSEYGMRIYACTSAGAWVLIGYNTGDSIQEITSDILDRDAYTFRGAINVMLIGAVPGDVGGNSILEVDTISVENSESIATHLGGFVDSYIDALCIEAEYTITPDPVAGVLYIDNSDKGIVHVIGLTKSGIALAPHIDYTLVLDEYSYTCRGSISIKTRYTSGDVVVKALTCPALVTINTGMAERGLSPIGYDLLVKHRVVHYLDVLGDARASVLPLLSSYIKSLPRVDGDIQLSYAQFIFYLLQNGVTTRNVIITDSYLQDEAIIKTYLNSTADTLSLDKISCFRVSSGQ